MDNHEKMNKLVITNGMVLSSSEFKWGLVSAEIGILEDESERGHAYVGDIGSFPEVFYVKSVKTGVVLRFTVNNQGVNFIHTMNYVGTALSGDYHCFIYLHWEH